MKKLILSFFMIAMLTGCVSESVSRNEINTDFEELCNYFDIDKLESEKSYQNDNYENYITYEINNHMNYSEKADIINYSFFGNEKYLRHISVETDASNGVNNVDMDWYKYNENGDICETDSQFYAENILGKMQSFDLTSELGEKLYNEDYLFAKETNSSVGTIEVFYCDMNKDGKDDIISYIEAPWIQGKDKNIRLSVSVDGEDGLIPLEDEIFLLNIRNNPLIFVNIEESDTDMRNIVVEYFYRETAEYNRISYIYNAEKRSYVKQEEITTTAEEVVTTAETKELSEKELLSEYIEYYKEYFKDNYSENPTEEVSVFFCDFDDDGKYEASLRYPELWIKNYNEATKTVEEMREWGHISGANKYRLASGEEIYIYQPDNQFLFYSQFENGRYVGGEYLLGNAYFDDRVKKEVTYFYFVGDIAAEGLDTPIEYVNSRIEHEPIKDNLVTKETYEKVIKEFYEKTEPVPVCIKTLSMTVDEWLTLSTEEILEKTEDDVLASELPEHKIDEGEDYEN